MTRGRIPRLATVTVEETMEAEDATRAALRLMHLALRDGVVTVEEERLVVAQLEAATEEAREAVVAAERADVAELVMAAGLSGQGLSPHLAQRSRDIGLRVVVIHPAMPDPVAIGGEPLEAA